MKKVMEKLAACVEYIGGIAILAMTLIVLLQIVMRYIFKMPLTWTEELARYIFIYITFLGAGLLVYERGHLFVEVVFNNLPHKIKKIIQMIIDIIICGFSIYLIISSKTSMQFASGSRSTAMQIPMPYIGLSVMIGAILMTIFSFYNITLDLKNWKGEK